MGSSTSAPLGLQVPACRYRSISIKIGYMSRGSKLVVNEESYFGIEELFFSRTDLRGIILSGNEVFKRVSEFEWEELISKPHSLIRHPDMPRGVFYLLWKFLLGGEPICAYVKNRSKTGKYYWVLALALPIEGGFISIRLKPSSEIFSKIPEIYRSFLQNEELKNWSPQESCEQLEKAIQGMGFADYRHFMAVALSHELQARQKKMSEMQSESVASIALQKLGRQETLVANSEGIFRATNEMLKIYHQNRYVSLNLNVEALKKQDGKTMGTVAQHFQKMASEVETEISSFNKLASETLVELRSAQLLILSEMLISEMQVVFEKEHSTQTTRQQDEKILRELKEQYLESVHATYIKTKEVLRRLGSRSKDVSDINNGLEIIRLTGKIEASRSSELDGCMGIINGLQEFLKISKSSMDEIQNKHREMTKLIEALSA